MSQRKGKTARVPTGDYEVGYCRTPPATRFKPGESGNPHGRPRRVPSTADTLESLLGQKVEVTADGGPRKMSLNEVRLRAVLKRATAGDLKANALIERLRAQTTTSTAANEARPVTDDEDEALIAAALRRLAEREEPHP